MVVAIELSNFVVINLRFRVVDGEDSHKVIARIGKPWHRLANLSKVLLRFLCITLVDDVTICHEDQSIEVVESFRAWLVNGANDSFTFVSSQLLEQPANFQSLERVKTASWLIK